MGNTRLFIGGTHRSKSGIRIKPGGMRLRAEPERGVPLGPGQVDRGCQQGPADPTSTPGWQHCHAADMTVGQQPGAADSGAVSAGGEQMQGIGIVGIPLQRLGHALLIDKNRASYRS